VVEKQRVLTQLLQSLTALAALLFLIGWTYGHAYYGTLGIGLNQLEIPVTSYMVWCRTLMFEKPVVLLFLPGLLISLRWWLPWVLPDRWKHIVPSVNPVVWILLVYLLVAIYGPFVVNRLGHRHAERDAHQQTTTLPKIILQLKTPPGEDEYFLDTLREQNISDGAYIFLGQHRDVYYVMPYRGALRVNQPLVVVLPRELIGTIQVME
jgi:hypothetical protein